MVGVRVMSRDTGALPARVATTVTITSAEGPASAITSTLISPPKNLELGIGVSVTCGAATVAGVISIVRIILLGADASMLLLFNVQSAGCNGPKMAVPVAPLPPDSDRSFAAGIGDPPLIATGIVTALAMLPSVIVAVAVAVPTVLPAASVNVTLGGIVKSGVTIATKRTASLEAGAIVAVSVWAPDGMLLSVCVAVPLVGVAAGTVKVPDTPPADSIMLTSAAPVGPSVTVAVTTKLSVSPGSNAPVMVTSGRIVTVCPLPA